MVQLVSRSVVMPEARALAGVIRRRRQYLQLSPEQLARRAGVSRQTVENIEQDIHVPTADMIARLAHAFGITYGEINLAVDGWLARQPACCRVCNYTCIALGELPWLNRERECVRPKS